MVIIKEFESTFKEEFIKLKILQPQNKFVHFDLEEIIKSSKIYSNRYLYNIFKDKDLIGFAYFQMFDKDMFLLKFMIDYRHQGKGHATNALPKLIKLIEPNLVNEELWISVHPKNTIAIGLYNNIGFSQEVTSYDADDEIFLKYIYN